MKTKSKTWAHLQGHCCLFLLLSAPHFQSAQPYSTLNKLQVNKLANVFTRLTAAVPDTSFLDQTILIENTL